MWMYLWNHVNENNGWINIKYWAIDTAPSISLRPLVIDLEGTASDIWIERWYGENGGKPRDPGTWGAQGVIYIGGSRSSENGDES
jgi:hypothetical protein